MTKIHIAAGEAGEPVEAHSLSVGTCECCGGAQLRLHDQAGRVFALGTIDRPTALRLCEEIVDQVEQPLSREGGQA